MAAVALFMVGRLAKFNDIFTSTVPTINNFSNHALRINCLTLFVQLKIQNNILFLYTTQKLNNVNRLYYLLYASENGFNIDDEQNQKIFEAVVNILSPNSEWLEVNKISGVVQPNNAAGVVISFNSRNISSGTYEAILQIDTNDPSNRDLSLPITVTVQDPIAQDIVVSPLQLNFGQLTSEASSSIPLTITNSGEDFLHISNVSLEGVDFSLDNAGDIRLDNGESTQIFVTFNPWSQGEFNGTITIHSNDTETPEITVGLNGSGLVPDGSVTTDELNITLEKSLIGLARIFHEG